MIVPPPRPDPAPRQVFPSNIRAITFPSVGGLVFVRVEQTWLGTTPGPGYHAGVSFPKLPWKPFDMFGDPEPVADSSDHSKNFDIVNPVTDGMLAHWLHWEPKPPVKQDHTKTTPGIQFPVIDIAGWYGVYNNHDNGQAATGTREGVEELLYNAYNSFFGNVDRSKFGVRLADVYDPKIRNYRAIRSWPDPEWDQIFYGNGWSYHLETGPSYTSFTSNGAAVLILNLTKAFRDIPNDPLTGKKPPTFTFRIDAQTSDGITGTLGWQVIGYSNSTKKASTPPADSDGRRDFPLKETTEGSGDTAMTHYLVPDFEAADATAEALNPTGAAHVIATVTFGTPKVKPKIEFEVNLGGVTHGTG